MDGNVESGLRPSSGFKKVHDLSFLPHTNHDLTSVVLDFYPVQFSIGSNGYAYGFLYRVKRSVSSGAAYADIFLDYWNSVLGVWSKGNLVAEDVSLTSPWSRVAWGRFVFVFVKGRGASMFYINPTTHALHVTGRDVLGPFPGPGKRPLLVDPDSATILGAFESTAPASERPCTGQVVLCTVLPSASYLYPGPNGGYNHSHSNNSSSGSNAGADCVLPTDSDPRMIEPGDYTFAYQLIDSQTGRKSSLSEVAQVRKEDFSTLVSTGSDSASSASGDDTYQYQSKYAVMELVYDSNLYDQAFIYRSIKVQDAGGTLISAILFLDKIIDLECYQTVRNGPGADFDPASTSLRHATYWYELEDKQLTYQDVYIEKPLYDEEVPRAGTAIMYENSLLCSNIARPPSSTEDGNRVGDTLRGLGEIRWSALGDAQPELFAPSSRYVPSVPSTEILRFQPAGSNIMGFSASRQFFIRKDSTAIRVVETHKGYGIVGPHAAETIGSTIYIVTRKGMKTVDASTQLDDIRSLNNLIMQEWDSATLDKITLAFDPAISALFCFNPAESTAAVIWYNSARVSEFHDLPFLQVQFGQWPVSPDIASAPLDERALWLQEYPRDAEGEAAPSGWKPRIFVYDADRSKTIGGGSTHAASPRLTTLDFAGDSRFEVHTSFFTGTSIRLKLAGGLVAPGGGATDGTSGLEGAYLYVVASDAASIVGKKVRIKRISGTGPDYFDVECNTGDEMDAIIGNLVQGDRVALSPVPLSWTGSPLAVQTADGQDYGGQGFFRIRHVDSIGACFTSVSGPASSDGTTDAKFFGQVFRGDDAAPAAKGLCRARGTGTALSSIVEGTPAEYAAMGEAGWALTANEGKFGVSGAVLCPSLMIVCPDLDFRLMAVRVKGRVTDQERIRHSS